MVTISISSEAYELLQRHKQLGESFSLTIIRLLQVKGDPEMIRDAIMGMDEAMVRRMESLYEVMEENDRS